MDITFLKTEGESLALFLAAGYYVYVLFKIQAEFIELIQKKRLGKKQMKKELKHLFIKGVKLMLIGPIVHFAVYWIFYDLLPYENGKIPQWRNEYLLWIVVTFLVFVITMSINFFLKGTSTLPTQDGPVTGV